MKRFFANLSHSARITLTACGCFILLTMLILIFLMYFGRVGGLTMIYAMAAGSNGASSQYPQEQVTVG